MIGSAVYASSYCDCWLCRDHKEGLFNRLQSQNGSVLKVSSQEQRKNRRTTKKSMTRLIQEGGRRNRGTSGCKDGASNRAVEGGSMVWHVAHCEETSGFSVDSPNRLFHSHRRVSPRVVLGGPEGSRGVESDACSTPLTTDSDERDKNGALPSRRFNRSRQECFTVA